MFNVATGDIKKQPLAVIKLKMQAEEVSSFNYCVNNAAVFKLN